MVQPYASIYSAGAVAASKVWLWLWPWWGLYIAMYPRAAPVSFTNDIARVLHSTPVKKLTLTTAVIVRGGQLAAGKSTTVKYCTTRRERAVVHFPICCGWGDKMSIWSTFLPFFLFSLDVFVFDIYFSTQWTANILIAVGLREEKAWCSSLLTSPLIKKGPKAGRDTQHERYGRNAISLSEDAPYSRWGLGEALSSVQSHRLWHIWVMCFTLELLDAAPKMQLAHTQQHPGTFKEKMCSLCPYTPLISFVWARLTVSSNSFFTVTEPQRLFISVCYNECWGFKPNDMWPAASLLSEK